MKIMTACAALLAILLVTACAPVNERQRDERQYDRLDFEAKFLDFSRRCKARGGVLVVQRNGRLKSDNVPRRSDRFGCI